MILKHRHNIMKLPTQDMPYEIRRNPLQISLFKHKKLVNHKLVLDDPVDKDLRPFVVKQNTEPVQPTETFKYVYVYRTMSLDNYGHFVIDNLIPLYKMIVLTQGYDFRREDVLFCFLKAPQETKKQQTLSGKQNNLLQAFSSHPIRFIEDIPDMAIDNLVLPFLGLGQSISFCKWQEYSQPNEDASITFLHNFRKRLINHFKIKQNIPDQRIFLSRKGAKHRRVTNESELTTQLQLTPVTFENKTISEELQTFSDSKLTVMPYGAGIVGAFFQQPNSTCVIIHPKGFDERYDFPQIYTQFLRRLHIRTVVYHNIVGRAGPNIFRNRDSHIQVDINDFKEKLKL